MSSNLELLVRVARKVEPILDRLVFVGGAVVELYFTDPASDRVRPTTDTDAICGVSSYTAYHRLGDRLRELSFTQSLRASDPPYRWRSGDDILDVMPRDESVLGFTNSWYGTALEQSASTEIEPGLTIRVPEPPVFLATKLAAHEDRGHDDPFMSTDLEDVIALVANRSELVTEAKRSDPALRNWIGARIVRFVPPGESREIVGAFLPEARQLPGLRPRVMERLDELRELAR